MFWATGHRTQRHWSLLVLPIFSQLEKAILPLWLLSNPVGYREVPSARPMKGTAGNAGITEARVEQKSLWENRFTKNKFIKNVFVVRITQRDTVDTTTNDWTEEGKDYISSERELQLSRWPWCKITACTATNINSQNWDTRRRDKAQISCWVQVYLD